MWNQWKTIVMLFLVCSSSLVVASEEKEESSCFYSTLSYIAVGAGLAAVAAPAALAAAGFTGAGITAGSLAATMMKVTAVANSGAVPAGSVVAFLQSVGATTGVSYVSGAVGGVVGYVYGKFTCESVKKEENCCQS
ncbi:interferon alpha-inducible protein 27, mitochondrial-like [Lissotriton helveticus]